MNDDPKNEGFWGPLGGYTDPASLPAGESDADVVVAKVTKLFELGAAAGAMDLVSEGPLSKSMLKSSEVYLLHSTDKLYVWVGKDAELETKRRATQAAVDYIKKVGKEDRKERRNEVNEDAIMEMNCLALLCFRLCLPSSHSSTAILPVLHLSVIRSILCTTLLSHTLPSPTLSYYYLPSLSSISFTLLSFCF